MQHFRRQQSTNGRCTENDGRSSRSSFMFPSIRSAFLLSFAAAAALSAQNPGGPPPGPIGPPPDGGASAGAQFMLGHTGELDLTDAQVVRLAAIARRSEARRRSMRAEMDSARERFGPESGPRGSVS